MMNEIIKELILEAGFPKFDKMYVVSDGEELEKFAQLIVAECADFLRDTMDDHFAAEQLEEHFGVE
jgi:hypothetical protein